MVSELRQNAIKEFFKHIVHGPVDWTIAELKYEGWEDSCPNLIKLLRFGDE